MPLFGARSKKARVELSALESWRALSARAAVSFPDLEVAISAGQHELPSRVGYTVLAGAYLVAAELAGMGAAPSNEACRFAGLAAVVVKRASIDVELPEAITRRYQVIRGKLRGSVFVPRDVEEAFAGRTERLEPLALDAHRLETVRQLLRQVQPAADVDDDIGKFVGEVGQAIDV